MNRIGYRTNIIKEGSTKGIRIPKDYLDTLGSKVILEKTKEGLLVRPAQLILPLKEWAKLFATADTTIEPEFNEWENTQGDGI